jgi:hypothetical protein
MCDEKWFHALVLRTNAKACEALGMLKSSYSATGKVMLHCTVGYLFTDDPELGGQGFLIGCNRCAAWVQNSFARYSILNSRPCDEETLLHRKHD